jgi:hypothetical protein
VALFEAGPKAGKQFNLTLSCTIARHATKGRTMRLPRVRFTVRRMIVAVAVAALVLLVASNSYRHDGITDKRVVIPVASVVAAVYGLGAMRRPLMFLLPLLAVWIATPQVDHPVHDVINISAGSCFLGWIIGSPVGWMSRRLTREA